MNSLLIPNLLGVRSLLNCANQKRSIPPFSLSVGVAGPKPVPTRSNDAGDGTREPAQHCQAAVSFGLAADGRRGKRKPLFGLILLIVVHVFLNPYPNETLDLNLAFVKLL
jgi:hypothetical protein